MLLHEEDSQRKFVSTSPLPPLKKPGKLKKNDIKRQTDVSNIHSAQKDKYLDQFHIEPVQISRNFPKLSHRETEVLQFLADGLTPEQTALRMAIKTCTVRKYLTNLRKKFKTDSRDQLMARAGYLGFCDPYKEEF